MIHAAFAARRWGVWLALAALVGCACLAGRLIACPFCSAVSQTFTEEMNTMDAVVIARLVQLPPPEGAAKPAAPADKPADKASAKPAPEQKPALEKQPGDAGQAAGTKSKLEAEIQEAYEREKAARVVALQSGEELPKARFEVVQVVKGDKAVQVGATIETLFFGKAKPGDKFLIMGVEPPKLQWSTPLPVTDRGQEYLGKLLALPKEGAERLAFFQNFLEDKDEMLARDAYDEFAKAPYDAVKSLKERMNHDQLIAWIKDYEGIPASRRRLYLTMLGVCGTEADLPLLEEFLKATDRKAKQGLDALIACYLTLKGADGLPLVDELFLTNKSADYAETYAAIMAIRFHGTEGDQLPRKKLVQSLRHMLERPELADLVIPDLARWEDWEAADKLMELYRKADDKSSWVRVPVINFLRACPLPRAKELLTECEKIDPAAVKRANTFFPFGPSAAPQPPKTSRVHRPEYQLVSAPAASEPPVVPAAAAVAAPAPPLANANLSARSAEAQPAPRANRWVYFGVPTLLGLALAALQWNILRGAGRGD